jgi:uncharacterized repeat protein (TIGR03803 family)
MHGNSSSHTSFGLSLANISIALLLALFLLIMLLAWITITAPSAYGQQSVPPTARQAATIPQFAAKLARRSQPLSPPIASRVLGPSQLRATYKNPQAPRSFRANGGPLDYAALYDNGPINGTTDAWSINFGFVVSDSFTIPSSGGNVTALSFGAWLFPGDVLQTVEVQITSAEFGGTTYTDQVITLAASGCSGNQYGFNVCTETGSLGTSVNLSPGTYWVNLDNGVVNTGDPVYWDENSGPSMASENSVGTIPSEAFAILGAATTTTCIDCGPPPPPPCFQSGIIHDFQNEGPPSPISLDRQGKVYGTTLYGGNNGLGVVYRLAETVQDWLYTVLYSFTGDMNGQEPGGVIVGPDGALYGTAGGGIQGNGLVYQLRPSPVACPAVFCSWNQTVLYRFTAAPDAFYPNGNLVFDAAGNLYGPAAGGGAYGLGAIYELSPANGGWTEKVVFNFGPDTTGGYIPNSLLVGHDGNLYGTASYGGDPNCGNVCGVVFQLTPSGDQWSEQVLHTFENSQADGAKPMNLVQDRYGNLYGISNYGYSGDSGGVEFVLSPSNGNWTFTELIFRYYPGYITDFTGLAIDEQGNTSVSGSTVFIYSPDCSLGPPYYCDWFVLGRNGVDYSQNIFDAYGLASDPAGKHLYGVTADCGRYNQGTVWRSVLGSAVSCDASWP